MDDLISKKAAIDAMAELQGRASTKAELKGISKAWKRIKELQPIQPEIVRCEECKYHHQKNCPIEKYFSLDGFCSRGDRGTT